MVFDKKAWQISNRERYKDYMEKYRHTPKGKKSIKAYWQRLEVKAKDKTRNKIPERATYNKVRMKAYLQTPEGKMANARHNSKRRGRLSIQMNKWFPGSEEHHINLNDTIYIPKRLHPAGHSVYPNQPGFPKLLAVNRTAVSFIVSQAAAEALRLKSGTC